MIRRSSIAPRPAIGFTTVELLVVIAIIGVLVALLLPAVLASREASRAQVCRNNLKQLALASLNHLATHGHFPSGGWGASWTGDPDRGYGKGQPGGWTYNILPFIEHADTHSAGAGLGDDRKREALTLVMQQPLALFHCPTRRPARPYPNSRPYISSNADAADLVARMDYAINAGDRQFNTVVTISDTGGPATLAEGDSTFSWPSTTGFTGISFLRSVVPMAQITDGTSHTYLIGEKYLDTRHYETGLIEADRGHLYIGFAPDTVRLTRPFLSPQQDTDANDKLRFGSAHVDKCFFAFCDGSVRAILYDIDPEVHRQNGCREDGN